MPPLDNAKHERFAQALAAGKHAVDAYEVAGYPVTRSRFNASKRSEAFEAGRRNPRNSRTNSGARSPCRYPCRIERVGLTKSAVMDMLLADRELARKNGQSSAAIRATELL